MRWKINTENLFFFQWLFKKMFFSEVSRMRKNTDFATFLLTVCVFCVCVCSTQRIYASQSGEKRLNRTTNCQLLPLRVWIWHFFSNFQTCDIKSFEKSFDNNFLPSFFAAPGSVSAKERKTPGGVYGDWRSSVSVALAARGVFFFFFFSHPLNFTPFPPPRQPSPRARSLLTFQEVTAVAAQ